MHMSGDPIRPPDNELNKTEHGVAVQYRTISELSLSELGVDSVIRGELDCPSMLPDLARAVIAKVVVGEERLEFVAEEIQVPASLPLAADPESLLRRARFVGSCRAGECGHWTGVSCRLGHAIARVDIPSSIHISRCSIRSSCRWYKENGSAACRPCQHVRYVPIEVRQNVQSTNEGDPDFRMLD